MGGKRLFVNSCVFRPSFDRSRSSRRRRQASTTLRAARPRNAAWSNAETARPRYFFFFAFFLAAFLAGLPLSHRPSAAPCGSMKMPIAPIAPIG